MLAQIKEVLDISQQAEARRSNQARPHQEEVGLPHQVDEPETKHGHECVMDPAVINLVQENQLAGKVELEARQPELECIENPIVNLAQKAEQHIMELAPVLGAQGP